jgi:hypothetical protein
MSYVIIWSYDVPPQAINTFAAAYGPDGDWVHVLVFDWTSASLVRRKG